MSMINTKDILETIKMIEEEHLDIRTIDGHFAARPCGGRHQCAGRQGIRQGNAPRGKLVATGERLSASLVSRSSTSVFR